MKFIELKKELTKNLKNCYLIEGEDRFVVSNALSLIEKKVNLSMPDVNRVVLENDKATLEELDFQLSSFPFGDQYKLIIVRDFNFKDNKKLETLLKNLPEFIVLVFVSFMQTQCTKLIKSYSEFVDCSKLEPVTIKSWIVNTLAKSNVQIEEGAVERLVLYTNSNMARIETEVSKLVSFGENLITTALVEKNVVRDKEYQIYELADFLSKKDSERAYDLIQTMLETEKNGVGLVQYLYSAFRKLLIISLSNESDEELSKTFKCKPYAIKMNRAQAKKFGAKNLKRINEELSALEFDLKSGKANQDNAVHIVLAKILMA